MARGDNNLAFLLSERVAQHFPECGFVNKLLLRLIEYQKSGMRAILIVSSTAAYQGVPYRAPTPQARGLGCCSPRRWLGRWKAAGSAFAHCVPVRPRRSFRRRRACQTTFWSAWSRRAAWRGKACGRSPPENTRSSLGSRTGSEEVQRMVPPAAGYIRGRDTIPSRAPQQAVGDAFVTGSTASGHPSRNLRQLETAVGDDGVDVAFPWQRAEGVSPISS